MTPTPLVSCIMPTRDRPWFVRQAIWYFERQDYPARELVIVDDGEDSVAPLVPGDERIRYVRLDRRLDVGAKRNLACEQASGELIANWDDDDWHAPARLSVQARALAESRGDACGLARVLHYHVTAGDALLFRGDGPSDVLGGTLLFRRSAWLDRRFPEVAVGEHAGLLERIGPARVHVLTDESLYVALIHQRNTQIKNLGDPRWERRPPEELVGRLGSDREFYVELRNGKPRALPPPQRRRTGVTVSAPFRVDDGYGSIAEYLVLGLDREGAGVHLASRPVALDGLSPEFLRIVGDSTGEVDGPVLLYDWPRASLGSLRDSPELFLNTMWESDRLPADCLPLLDRARAVIVPSRFLVDAFRESGVRSPIEVVPEGIDPAVYHYEERPPRQGLTTLIVGPPYERKNTQEGIAAWKATFAGDSDARLVIKSRFGIRNFEPDDPRITLVDASEPTRGIAHWYRRADVLLALGSEGFGLPLVEGMATGLPVVALDWGGQADVCEQAADSVLAVPAARFRAYVDPVVGDCGRLAAPAVEDVAERLRWVKDHRDEAVELGRRASEWAIENRNVWQKAPAVLDVMERYVGRTLRRLPTLWVPSLGTTCGVAEYTSQLAGALPAVRVVKDSPAAAEARLLHVQHEYGLFDSGSLERTLEQIHEAGVPTVVTEHAVKADSESWERQADVLVTASRRGAELLRSKWPGSRVEHIPHGCPTWFPRRKRTRGCVIGAFGFLSPYKGFWQLLDVLRRLPATQLLLFSHARSREFEERWEADAAGLPVVREPRYLPTAEAARRLAAEADILVYWYDEVPHASASGAVRIGLATGVPVLASPTAWFEDLLEETFQPTDLVEGVQRLLDDTPLRRRVVAAARDHCHDHSWARIAERHVALWRELEANH
jgi:glycosyltransferase involved in cell wall biosynthesis